MAPKYLFLIFLITTNLLAVEAQLNICKTFKTNVLEKAYFVEEGPKDEHNLRFVKDEKLAIKYLTKYDSDKLGENYNFKQSMIELKECTDGSRPSVEYCSTTLPNLNFFRGLIHGIKNYGWSESTRTLALKKLRDYLKETTESEKSLLVSLTAAELIKEMYKAKLLKSATEEQLQSLKILTHSIDDGENPKRYSCTQLKNRVTKELEVSTKIQAQIKALLW